MGVSCLSSCSTNENAQAPDPSRWALLRKTEYPHGYALMAEYFGCDTFEGRKIMVYRGQYKVRRVLDPHFADTDDSPIARFKPDEEGWDAAVALVQSLKPLPPIQYGKTFDIPASLLTKKGR